MWFVLYKNHFYGGPLKYSKTKVRLCVCVCLTAYVLKSLREVKSAKVQFSI